MKRSTHVVAPLLAAAAMSLLVGCRDPEMQRCVDENNKVVDDSLCKVPGQPTYGYRYHYYYGGSGSYSPGTIATGGGTQPISGVSYSTTRGGFGNSFGGGEASSGGHGASAGE